MRTYFYDLTKHIYYLRVQYGIFHKESKAKSNVEYMRWITSNPDFEQKEEYDVRKKILKKLDFIDSNDTLTQKGRFATEVILHDFLDFP